MMFAIGVVLFALGITVSIALHEAGHMWTARKLGMKVRRYYIGFGPKIFSFRRGETEYGLKAIPAGGFCDIAGMTMHDDLAPDEVDRAMYKQTTWKRLVVMSGGIVMNFVLGLVLIFVLALGWGLPDRDAPTSVAVAGVTCVAPTQAGAPNFGLAPCTGPGPAERAGVEPGDTVTAVDGTPVTTSTEVVDALQPVTGVAELTVQRGDRTLTIPIEVEQVQRWVEDPDTGEQRSSVVGAVGISLGTMNPPLRQYNALTAIPGAVGFTGELLVQSVHGLVQLPSKVSDLWTAVTGGDRGQDTPMSVVGASVIGGQAAEADNWATFVLLLAGLNFFLGIFNLLPLLPLDGGHMAVAGYEKVRDLLRARRGLAAGGPVDYMKLMPLTYVVIVIGGAFMVLTLTADIVNPIKIF